MKSISNIQSKDIIQSLENGMSIREVANKCSVSKSTVQRIRSTLNIPSNISSSGRKSKLSPQNKRYCIRSITSGQAKSTNELSKTLLSEFSINVNRSTVSRILHSCGLKSAEMSKKPKLSPKNVRDRLDFANAHKDWTIDDWKRVIWSDETKINRFCSDGRSWYWSRDGTTLQPHNVKQTIKHGGGSIMVWGCMTVKGPGFICKIDGRMNQEHYISILDDELNQTIDYYNLNCKDIIFQQDNCPIHKAKSVMEYFKNQEYDILEWPAQSPDLNPIEHLWSKLKRELNKYDSPPNGIIELWQRVKYVWNEKITKDDCLNLIESMPRRIECVRKAKGWWTKY